MLLIACYQIGIVISLLHGNLIKYQVLNEWISACVDVFSRLKNELFYGVDWKDVTIDKFIQILNDYLVWYNEDRIKQSLNYLSPTDYRKRLGLAC